MKRIIAFLVSLYCVVPIFAFGQIFHYPAFMQSQPQLQQGSMVDSAYNNAMLIYNQGLYQQAVGEFTNVLNQCYQRCDLCDNAYYWIGMAYYNLRDYTAALHYFYMVRTIGGNKVPDANYMITIASSSEVINNRMIIPILTITPAQVTLMTPSQIQGAKSEVSVKIANAYRKLANNLGPESRRAAAREIAELYNESKILHGAAKEPIEKMINIIMTW